MRKNKLILFVSLFGLIFFIWKKMSNSLYVADFKNDTANFFNKVKEFFKPKGNYGTTSSGLEK